MLLRRLDNATIEIADIDPFIVGLLRQIPGCADPSGSEDATDRLYSKPASDSEEEFLDDWKSLVEPELKRLFESAIETVARDLAGMQTEIPDEEPSIRIPRAHFDAWLSSLNQARLVLSERHAFSEEDMDRAFAKPIEDERDLRLFQVAFYGLLQECLLDEMFGEGGYKGGSSPAE